MHYILNPHCSCLKSGESQTTNLLHSLYADDDLFLPVLEHIIHCQVSNQPKLSVYHRDEEHIYNYYGLYIVSAN